MVCNRCGYENREAAKYCARCGQLLPIYLVCPACAALNPPAHSFCDACGASLVGSNARAAGQQGEERGQAPPVSARLRPPIATALRLSSLSISKTLLLYRAFASRAARLTMPTAKTLPVPHVLTSRIPLLRRLLAPKALLLSGTALAVLGQMALVFSAPGKGPTALGVAALALGAALFALGCRGPASALNMVVAGDVASPRRVFQGKRALYSAAFGLFAMVVLLYELLFGSTSGVDLVFWLAALIGFGIPFFRRFDLSRIAPGRRIVIDVLVVLAVVVVFLALNLRDLGDWYYSVIGDEYAFYNEARGLLQDGISRPFSQRGVYGQQPVLNSVYQALVMGVAGQDNFGWRLSSVLSLVLTIPGIYAIGTSLGGRKVGATSAALFASSHYLFAYAHIGYNNLDALVPTVWAVALMVLGLRKGSSLLLYLAGLFGGLGFYTLYSARFTILIMLLFALTLFGLRKRLADLWPVGLGFVLAAMPIFAVSRDEVLLRMLSQVPGGYSAAVTGPAGERILGNLSTNLLAFNYSTHMQHYVSGSLADPITAVLWVLGLGLALRHLTSAPYKLLFWWITIAFTVTGILAPYPYVAVSRLNFVVPPLALLAGFAACGLWESFGAPRDVPWRRWLHAALLVVLLISVLGLNIKRFWFDTPAVFHSSQYATALGAMRSEACGGDPDRVLIVSRDTASALRPALVSYYPGGSLPRLLDEDKLVLGQPIDVGSARCVIFAFPAEPKERSALEALQRQVPGGKVSTFRDKSGKANVTIFSTVSN